MTTKFTEDQIAEFKEAYEIFDKDGDGSISTKELGTVMRSLGQILTEDTLNQMIEEVDIDKSGTIDFREFLGLMEKKLRENDTEDELLEAFRVFDRDGKGYISVKEYKYILASSGENLMEEEIDNLVSQIDSNNDGYIDYEDFVRVMMTQ